MAKPDPSMDYYAELNIPTDAQDEDIKKAYRKLALKYHPDRNHGREDEVQPKFQAISAAHDILLDPELRRRYDLSRKRGVPMDTAFTNKPPRPRGTPNPYQANTTFDPPPRPPGFAQRTRTGEDARPSSGSSASGASRYTSGNWQPPPRPPPNPNTKQSRANVFDAWQKMNNAQKTKAQRPAYNVPPQWEGSTPSSKPPRSAYEEIRYNRPPPSRSGSTRMPPRKGGFDPSTPDRDESQAPSAGYSTYARNNAEPPNIPPRPAPTAQRPTVSTRTNSSTSIPNAGRGMRDPDSHPRLGKLVSSISDPLLANQNSARPRSHSPTRRTPADAAPGHDGIDGAQYRRYHSGTSGKPFIVHDDLSSEDPSSESDGDADITAQPEAARTDASGQSDSANPTSRPKAKPSAAWQARSQPPRKTPESHEPRSFSSTENINGTNSSNPGAPQTPSANDTFEAATGPSSARPETGGFAEEVWQQNLKGENWAANWAHPSGPTSPGKGIPPSTRRTRPLSSRPPPPRAQQQPHPVTVEDIPEHLEQGDLPEAAAAAAATNSANGILPDPMDIDEPSPPQATPNASATPPPPRPNLSMNDFRHVAPFTTATEGGISSLDDLKATLPFESRPSNKHPRRSSRNPPEIPDPPRGPLAPDDPRKSSDQWETHLAEMRTYLHKWNIYNARMVAHFQERSEQQAQSEGGSDRGWLDEWFGVRGETAELKGWDSYMAGLKEDAVWRARWGAACDLHAGVMERHDVARQKMMG